MSQASRAKVSRERKRQIHEANVKREYENRKALDYGFVEYLRLHNGPSIEETLGTDRGDNRMQYNLGDGSRMADSHISQD